MGKILVFLMCEVEIVAVFFYFEVVRIMFAYEMKWNDMIWYDIKWDNVKWNDMKWNDMKWNEMILNEMILNEMISNEMIWNEMTEWCDLMRWNHISMRGILYFIVF